MEPHRRAVARMLAVAFAMTACGNASQAPSAGATAPRADVLRVPGRVEPRESVELGSLASGLVVEVSCAEGDRVHAGQRCARIDPRAYLAALAGDAASLRAARARVAKDRAALAYAAGVLDRDRGLAATEVVSQESLEAAQDAHAEAGAQLDADEAAVTQAEAALARARLELERTNVVSPVDGIVSERRTAAGAAIVASQQAPVLFVVESDGAVATVAAEVGEADAGRVAVGRPARIEAAALHGASLEGVVRRVGVRPRRDGAVVVVDVKVDVVDGQRRLRPGMSASVVFGPLPAAPDRKEPR